MPKAIFGGECFWYFDNSIKKGKRRKDEDFFNTNNKTFSFPSLFPVFSFSQLAI
jgi:hypothetical protein